MRVLLDEQLDRRLKNDFSSDYEVWTVADRGWKGMKNGKLLRATAQEFGAFITMDKGIEHQQNWQILPLAIVIISAKTNRYADVAPAIPEVNEVLRRIQEGELAHVSA